MLKLLIKPLLIALPESIFRLTIMIFKIPKGIKQSTPNAASLNRWIFDILNLG